MTLLARFEILGLFLNPLTSEAKYSRNNMGNLPQPIQVHLS